MKKVLAICLIVVMVMSMNVNVFAARGGFVSSPSGNRPPVIVEFDPPADDCTATLVITPYGDRHDLPEEIRKWFEDAYKAIVDSEDLTDLNEELEKLADDKNIDGSKLAVSDLFHLDTSGCTEHDGHTDFDITLSVDALDHFVGLMYMDSNGKWHWVPDAKVVNGEHLQFTADGVGPYAIIVDTTEDKPAKTGDSNIILVCSAMMAISAVALAVVLMQGKKQRF